MGGFVASGRWSEVRVRSLNRDNDAMGGLQQSIGCLLCEETSDTQRRRTIRNQDLSRCQIFGRYREPTLCW